MWVARVNLLNRRLKEADVDKCEVCGKKAEVDVCGHEVCVCCMDVVSVAVDAMFQDPEALREIREQVAARNAAWMREKG